MAREKKLARVIFLIIYLKVGFWRRGGAFKVTEEPVRGRRYANESGVFPREKGNLRAREGSPFYEKLKEYLSLVLCGKDTKDEMRSMYEKLFSIYIINRRLRKGLKLFRLKKKEKKKNIHKRN